ncbi:hypothetical protein [Nannocystis bainbridge]|uniref:Uncharacterized protein n=1 Tax=Nannocystis bainbridge TaxID=2995303 RepID=A0ABT5E232_9BACT|nr:hypothetical protein [Nannocystis bainbridge]MDC0719932.1 hypothetical protein [Nannocystis bainbridge]
MYVIPSPVRVPLAPVAVLLALAAFGGVFALDQPALSTDDPGMRHHQLAAAAFLLLPSCNDTPQEAAPGSAQEGEACDDQVPPEKQLCGAGLVCYSVGALDFQGYCAPACPATGCDPVEGLSTVCDAGACVLQCEGPEAPCPAVYDVALFCFGSTCSLDMSEDNPTAS